MGRLSVTKYFIISHGIYKWDVTKGVESSTLEELGLVELG